MLGRRMFLSSVVPDNAKLYSHMVGSIFSVPVPHLYEHCSVFCLTLSLVILKDVMIPRGFNLHYFVSSLLLNTFSCECWPFGYPLWYSA